LEYWKACEIQNNGNNRKEILYETLYNWKKFQAGEHGEYHQTGLF
jgi:hypothetical protein